MNSRDASTPVQLLDKEQLAVALKAGTAPKIEPEQLDALIVSEQYHLFPGTTLITCVLTLKNGFTVTGESACADPANFKVNIGRTIARRNARDKIWSLEGYVLRNKLALIEAAGAPTGAIAQEDVKTYVGTKVVHAIPMNRAAYNKLRGWELPADENGDDPGYLVEYVEGGAKNMEHFNGYVSWSPQDVFEKAYDVGVVLKKTTHVERMIKELEELTERTLKLHAFLGSPAFSSLPVIEQDDLESQHSFMMEYATILSKRVRRAAKEPVPS